jgi:hypothetical protein
MDFFYVTFASCDEKLQTHNDNDFLNVTHALNADQV